MRLTQLLETTEKLLAVVYGGRFQPFHPGHYAAYKALVKAFGKGPVWIATSNKTNFNAKDGDISPFTFDEKVEIITSMFDINLDKIIQCKHPAFSPVEVLNLYKAPVICVLACGKKDVERYKDSDKYAPYPMKHGKPMPFASVKHELTTDVMYYLPLPNDADISGTKVRRELLAAKDEAHQVEAFKKIYGKDDGEVRDLIISKLHLIKDEA